MLKGNITEDCNCPSDCETLTFTYGENTQQADPRKYCDNELVFQSEENIEFVRVATAHMRVGEDGLFYRFDRYARDNVFLPWPDLELAHERYTNQANLSNA